MQSANSKNIPGWGERSKVGLSEMDDLLRRYLRHYKVFCVEHLPQYAWNEFEFRQKAIIQRHRPDVFKLLYPNFRWKLDDRPEQFIVK